MIIDYDQNPNLTTDEKLKSLKESVQRALDSLSPGSQVVIHKGGTSSYNDLTDKPQVEGVTLTGNKTFPELNLDILSNSEIEAIFT